MPLQLVIYDYSISEYEHIIRKETIHAFKKKKLYLMI